ncbi:hypothetical protein LIER_20223 [Lithospermum erythrorhizon]|uniref:Uncharacterized protein n=1 Tax=Lithospermum erythrorhizon TaxID=34254 RepID=A0AAV3QNQ4_LITER
MSTELPIYQYSPHLKFHDQRRDHERILIGQFNPLEVFFGVGQIWELEAHSCREGIDIAIGIRPSSAPRISSSFPRDDIYPPCDIGRTSEDSVLPLLKHMFTLCVSL